MFTKGKTNYGKNEVNEILQRRAADMIQQDLSITYIKFRPWITKLIGSMWMN